MTEIHPTVLGPALDAILSAATDNGGSFTCDETDAIYDLFCAAGREDEGDLFREYHAEGDDEGDLHYGLRSRVQ